MAGGKIKGISKKEGGGYQEILTRSADTKRALPPMRGVIGGSAFPLEEGNHQLSWWKLRLKL